MRTNSMYLNYFSKSAVMSKFCLRQSLLRESKHLRLWYSKAWEDSWIWMLKKVQPLTQLRKLLHKLRPKLWKKEKTHCLGALKRKKQKLRITVIKSFKPALNSWMMPRSGMRIDLNLAYRTFLTCWLTIIALRFLKRIGPCSFVLSNRCSSMWTTKLSKVQQCRRARVVNYNGLKTELLNWQKT